MNVSHRTKVWLALLWISFLFLGFPYFGIFVIGNNLYLLAKGVDRFFYSNKSISLVMLVPFFITCYPPLILNFMLMERRIKKTKLVTRITSVLFTISAIWFVLSLVSSIIITPFVTNYVKENYTPCGRHSGIFSGTVYIRGDAACHRE